MAKNDSLNACLAGKVALVTGAGAGIGRASAEMFAAAGAKVMVCDISEAGAAETVELIRASGGEAQYVLCDVSDPTEVDAMIAKTVSTFGRIDCAHNNAGKAGLPTGLLDLSDEQWAETIGLNLTGVFACMRAELRVMLGQGCGAIVNTASGAGLAAYPELPAYTASKHGVIGLTAAAALEFGNRGIRVNAVCPGSTTSPGIEAYARADPVGAMKLVERTCPNGRMATPTEIAHVVVWLASDLASYVNGAALPVDGGAHVSQLADRGGKTSSVQP